MQWDSKKMTDGFREDQLPQHKKLYLTREEVSRYLVTFSNQEKKVDNFYVRFMGLPENVSNFLGRQVIRCSRPQFTFETPTTNLRHNIYHHKAQLRFSPVEMTMVDDENSITNTILNAQIMRQMNLHTDIFGQMDAGEDRNYRFSMRVEYFNSLGRIVEGYEYLHCLLTDVSHDEVTVTSDDNATLRATVTFDAVRFLVLDEYLDVMPSVAYGKMPAYPGPA